MPYIVSEKLFRQTVNLRSTGSTNNGNIYPYKIFFRHVRICMQNIFWYLQIIYVVNHLNWFSNKYVLYICITRCKDWLNAYEKNALQFSGLSQQIFTEAWWWWTYKTLIIWWKLKSYFPVQTFCNFFLSFAQWFCIDWLVQKNHKKCFI